MLRLTVTVALLFLACAHAAPANPKFTLVKDSSFAFAVAGSGSMSSGVAEAIRVAETPVEAPLPGNTGDSIPDVIIVDNVNSGSAIAFDKAIAAAIVKNKSFANGGKPFFK